MALQLTHTNKIYIRTGMPSHCHRDLGKATLYTTVKKRPLGDEVEVKLRQIEQR